MPAWPRPAVRLIGLLLLLWHGLVAAGLPGGWCCEPQAACCVTQALAGASPCTPCAATPGLVAAPALPATGTWPAALPAYQAPALYLAPAALPWRPPNTACA